MAKREIEIMEIKEDPANDAALGIMIDVRGPFNEYAMIVVYFTEEFMRDFFSIRWFKDLPREEAEILKKYHQDFIRWAIAKTESWIRKEGTRDAKLIIDYEADAGWADRVRKGEIELKSQKQTDTLYTFER